MDSITTMKKTWVIFWIFLLFSLPNLNSQEYKYFNRNNNETLINFKSLIQSGTEDIVLNISDEVKYNIQSKPAMYLKLLVAELTDWTEEDYLKIKSIHDWIAINIRYDYVGFDAGNIQVTDPYVTLRTGKAVCGGFATLFRAMTRMAGIDSEMIYGYSRGDSKYNIGNSSLVRHAWNAVKLSENWYLIDVTWDSAIVGSEYILYTNQFLFADPEEFVKTHSPYGVGWLLLNEEITMEEFQNQD
jgi:transglutaminase/protease-like cytokinesis protein 3